MDRIKSKFELFENLKAIHELDIDPVGFQIYLFGREDVHEEMEMGEPGIEYKLANRFIKNLDFLSTVDSSRPILITMKSCGGVVHEGMAIYDAIMAAPNPVTIVNYTHARSMTSIILQAANKRIMMPTSSFMYHQGDVLVQGTIKQVSSAMRFDEKFEETMLGIYIERIKSRPESLAYGWPEKKIRAWLKGEMDKKEDVYLTANEAVQWGFADEVFCDWDTVFDYTPEQKNIK